MTHYYSEKTASSMYKQKILDHRDQLESVLYPRPWVYLKKSGCLTENDDDIEAMKKLPAKFAIKSLIDLVLKKNDINTLTTFSKAVYAINRRKGEEVFPFADSLDGTPVTVPKKGISLCVSSLSCSLVPKPWVRGYLS